MPRPCHFEFQAHDPDRATKFYSGVFGWKFQKWDGPVEYWLIDTGVEGPGINGGMMRSQGQVNTVNTMDVDDLDAFVGRIVKAGGAVAVPKMAVPGVGWMAYCKDTESNLFGMMQEDPNAR